MGVGTPAADTAQKILDVAERLVQTRGYNAFSYADVAETLKVTKASLHYHFPSKAALGAQLIERYRTVFTSALAGIERDATTARDKLRRYVQIYSDVLAQDRICLCGMLAAELATLPEAMREGVRRFFDDNETWLATVLEHGRNAGEIRFDGTPRDSARLLIGSLEGAMLLASTYRDPERFLTVTGKLLKDFDR